LEITRLSTHSNYTPGGETPARYVRQNA
jgi:hypothetical protein